MENLIQDIRFGVRSFLKRPGFLVIAIATLAIGIGATTAMFTVVNSVLLRPLPFAEPERACCVSRARTAPRRSIHSKHFDRLPIGDFQVAI